MNGLAVCAGIGGIELGLGLAIPHYRTVGYIESDPFAVQVLHARMRDSILERVPIWPLVETWDSEGWTGKIDLVSSGFPCQPWSVAGKRRGFDDERWIWPCIARIIHETRPSYVFLENVVGICRAGLGPILRDLAQGGYDAEWDVFSARDCGAPHLRQRLFLLAYRPSGNGKRFQEDGRKQVNALREAGNGGARFPVSRRNRPDVGDSDFSGPQGRGGIQSQDRDQLPAWPPGPEELDQCRRILTTEPTLEPAICGMADGISDELEQSIFRHWQKRLRALGNAVVPVVAAVAFRTLLNRMIDAVISGPRFAG